MRASTDQPDARPRPTPPDRAVWLATAPDPVYGMMHEPATHSGVAVLICAPFGWEEVASHRGRRELAELMAARGHPTLRFDLPGTGDSGGGPRDAARLDAWTAAVSAAAGWLRARPGVTRVAAVGFGLGGLLASRAAALGAPLDELVLWGAPARGKDCVRELRAFSRMEKAWQANHGGVLDDRLPAGFAAAGGFLLTAETRAALEGLDVTELALSAGRPSRVLLLERDGIAPDKCLQAWFARAGTRVEVARGDGYGALCADPQQSATPTAAFEHVAGWLSAPRPAAPEPPPACSPVREIAAAQLEVGGVTVRETPLTVRIGSRRLVGVLAEPASGTRAQACAVLLNAGAQRRIGPNRMWVELSRRWAAAGVPTVRLDVKGVGDSDGESGPRPDAAFFTADFVPEVLRALDGLEARGLPPRFVLAGMCSGAYYSLHAALEDERVLAAFLVNARMLLWDERLLGARDASLLKTQVLDPSTWRRALRGDVRLGRAAELSWATLKHLLALPLRLRGTLADRRRIGHAGGDALDDAFDRLRTGGKRVLLLFAGDEPLRAELERGGRLARMDRWPNLRVETIALPVDTHTLRPVWLQAEVHECLDRALEEVLPGHAPPRAVEPSGELLAGRGVENLHLEHAAQR